MDKMANEIDQLNSEVDLLHLQLSNAEAKIFDLEQHQRIADYAQQLANIPDLMRLAKEHPELKKISMPRYVKCSDSIDLTDQMEGNDHG